MGSIKKTTRIDTENGLVGILEMPTTQPCPAVLMLHGFASHKDEVGDIFKRTAAHLAQKGIGSLRFDFSGWGESAGRMEDTTVQSLLGDARRMLNVLKSQEGIGIHRLGVLGFSLGSGVAMLLAIESPQAFRSMVLLSPVALLRKDFMQLLGADAFQQAANGQAVDIDLGWRRVRLSPAFFQGLDDMVLVRAMRTYTGQVLLIAGDADHSTRNIPVLTEAGKANQIQSVLLEEADHIFNVLSEKDASGEVIQRVAGWFLRTL